MANIDLIAATAFGLESVVARELLALGYESKIIGTGRVLFRGDERAICRANVWLRAADRVLIRLGTFPAKDFGELFEGVRALEWERWIGATASFPVNGRSVKSVLSSVPACQRIAKKAVVERLRSAHGVTELPETGPRCSIEVSMLEDVATLTLDTSGDGLHKRGYRQLIGEAQLKETLAAGLVLLSVWNKERPLVDPFCGSGTIPIEAALIGMNIAPGRLRTFDAVEWGTVSDEAWDETDAEAEAAPRGELAYPILGFDISEDALSLARFHAKKAGVQEQVRFAARDFRELSSSLTHGCTIMNPPYGDRIGRGREIEVLYRGFPEVLRRLPTWSHHVLTSWDDFEGLVGQRATRRRKLYNAQIECTYYQFLGPRPPAGGEAPAAGGVQTSEEGVVASEEPASAGSHAAAAEPAAIAPAVGFGGLRPRDVKELDEFSACLANNVRHLRKYPSRGITCYRVYERDAPDVPLIIDRYEDALHIQEYEREHGRTMAQHADWLDEAARRAAEVVGVPRGRVFVKRKYRQRGDTQHERVADDRAWMQVSEGGLRFEVNLSDYVDTGLFLDHRLTRQMVRERARGARFLNLFCYTGSFTVYAASGGAASTTSVDLSNTYLSWARRNLELNGLWGPRHELVKSDVVAWLGEQRAGARYDLVVVDPPTFSNSTMTEDVFDVQRDHVEMLSRVVSLCADGAEIYFSNNYRRFKLDEEAVAGMRGPGGEAVAVREISGRTVPPEYRNRRIHRCWRLRVGGAPMGGAGEGAVGDGGDGGA